MPRTLIRLTRDVLIGEQHGLTEGREFFVGRIGKNGRCTVKGDSGASVQLYRREFRVVVLSNPRSR